MKKALMFAAAAALATLSAPTNDDASAWGGAVVVVPSRGLLGLLGRPIVSPGLGVLGFVDGMTPLGRSAVGRTCSYLMEWASPFNPNLVGLCVLDEIRTPLNTSCILNAYDGLGIPRTVTAGGFDAGWGFACEGFDLLGVPADVAIIATAVDSCLLGVVIIDGCITLSLEI